MRALTVCEPFASALIFGGKDIENRTRPIAVHGPTIIQAGKSLEWYTNELCEWLNARWPECPANPTAAMHKFQTNHGKAIGVLWFGDGFDFGSREQKDRVRWHRWATGPWCIPVLGTPIPVKPFPLRGQQGPYIVPASQLPADVIAAAEKLSAAITQRFPILMPTTRVVPLTATSSG